MRVLSDGTAGFQHEFGIHAGIGFHFFARFPDGGKEDFAIAAARVFTDFADEFIRSLDHDVMLL